MPPLSGDDDPVSSHRVHGSPTTSTVNPSTPLRKAVYVHVSDLVSDFNIDPAKLADEIARIKKAETESAEKSASSDPPETDENAVDSVNISTLRVGTPDSSVETMHHHHSQKQRLQAPRGGFNLCVRVRKVNVVVDKLRVDRSRVRLAEVEVGDETGTVSLRARDDQIDILKEISERSGAVVLRNATLELYQARHLRLAVTKWGKLSVYPDNIASTPPPPSKMNVDFNFSLVDLSLVAEEKVPVSPSMKSESSPVSSPASHHRERTSPNQKNRGGRNMDYLQTQGSLASNRSFPSSQGPGYQNRRRDKRQQQQHTQTHATSEAMQNQYGYLGHNLPGAMYPPLTSYPPMYAEGMAMSQYPYAPSYQRHPEGQQKGQSFNQQQPQQFSDAQHGMQQRLLLQQYELQQRQLHEMQLYQEQQERQRRMLQHHQQQMHLHPQSTLMPDLLSSGSMDNNSIDYSVPQLGTQRTDQMAVSFLPQSGPSPAAFPVVTDAMGYAQQGQGQDPHHQDIPSFSTAGSQMHYVVDSPRISHQLEGSRSPRRSPGGGSIQWSTPPSSPMNPQASTYAPTFEQAIHSPHLVQSSGYSYYPYDPNQPVPGAMYASSAPGQQHIYTQGGMVYAPYPLQSDENNPSYTTSSGLPYSSPETDTQISKPPDAMDTNNCQGERPLPK